MKSPRSLALTRRSAWVTARSREAADSARPSWQMRSRHCSAQSTSTAASSQPAHLCSASSRARQRLSLIHISIFGALSMAMAASKTELNNKLADIKSQKAEVEAKLAEYEEQKDNYTGQIGTLNNKINLTEQEIDATEQAIDALTESIEETKANLKQAEKDLAEKQELFETRIRVMYENGDTSYMEAVSYTHLRSDRTGLRG